MSDWYRTPLSPLELDWLTSYYQDARFSASVSCWDCGHAGVVPCAGCPKADEAVPIEPKHPKRKTYIYDWRHN